MRRHYFALLVTLFAPHYVFQLILRLLYQLLLLVKIIRMIFDYVMGVF